MNFELVGMSFNDLEDVKRLADKVVPVLNHTRIWINKGNSANDLRRDHLTPEFKGARIVGREKLGRNEPCPCGSGLKYKKCCGK